MSNSIRALPIQPNSKIVEYTAVCGVTRTFLCLGGLPKL
jgi:hypothetical protein